MKRTILLLSWVALVWAVDSNLVAQQSNTAADVERLQQLLFDLPDVRFEQVEDEGDFPAFMLKIKQPIDHKNPQQGHFYQQVFLVHRGFDRQMLINTNGYSLNRGTMELFDLLQTNYISVEHRYFGPSSPDPRDWQYLTIQQAAADYHHIRQLLGQIYQSHWISTGISKGGETCTYYKFFYPDDVVVCIPYVAPFPIGLKDPRFYEFLDNAGTPECRQRIFEFQTQVLKHKQELVPRFKYYLKGRGSTVTLIGGPEAALELIVMEYPFGFWQGGKNCDDIPPADAAAEDLLDHLIESGDFWYLLDKSTENLAAHYYQHATQLGYYGYRAERFGDLIQKWNGEPSACFFPYAKDLEFDSSLRQELTQWLKTEAKNIIFLYGAVDTWTVAQAEVGDNKNVHKFIFEGKHHGNARLMQLDPELRDEILQLIRTGL